MPISADQLGQSLSHAEIIGNGGVLINGIQYDSRKVCKGDLFCAVRGGLVDGNRFITQAESKGAVAILTADREIVTRVTKILVPDDRIGMAEAAHSVFNNPTAKMELTGFGGTNGKTTCTFIMENILNSAGIRSGRIGTLGWQFEQQRGELERTTPEAIDLLRILQGILHAGGAAVALEVTSVAMTMKRLHGFTFAGGVFTNFSRDHLDVHFSMKRYLEAKRSFYQMLSSDQFAVFNLDDPASEAMMEGCSARIVTYGTTKKAEYRGEIAEQNSRGMKLHVYHEKSRMTLDVPMIGWFNAMNVLACTAAARSMEIDWEDIHRGVETTRKIRGRMETLHLEGELTAIIDYAHTPDALEKTVSAVKEITENHLWVLFGAGGDRDREKRPMMLAAVEPLADRIVVTSDNPRTEDPEKIIQQICRNASHPHIEQIVDRRQAISFALENAVPGDVILLAGKGGETKQEINHVKYPFDDREEVLKFRKRIDDRHA